MRLKIYDLNRMNTTVREIGSKRYSIIKNIEIIANIRVVIRLVLINKLRIDSRVNIAKMKSLKYVRAAYELIRRD